jgi:PAS domain S-box-containing protein
LILTWNTAAERLTGLSSFQVTGTLFFNLFHEERQKEILRILKKVYEQGESQEGEWDIVAKNQESLPIGWIFSGMKDENNNTVGIVAIGRDLRERKELEMELLNGSCL